MLLFRILLIVCGAQAFCCADEGSLSQEVLQRLQCTLDAQAVRPSARGAFFKLWQSNNEFREFTAQQKINALSGLGYPRMTVKDVCWLRYLITTS